MALIAVEHPETGGEAVVDEVSLPEFAAVGWRKVEPDKQPRSHHRKTTAGVPAESE